MGGWEKICSIRNGQIRDSCVVGGTREETLPQAVKVTVGEQYLQTCQVSVNVPLQQIRMNLSGHISCLADYLFNDLLCFLTM